jgi:hypothetical protein
MAKEARIYSEMDFDDSETESFLPKPISSVISKRRNLFNKFALSGWVFAIILFGINLYTQEFPRISSVHGSSTHGVSGQKIIEGHTVLMAGR